MVKLLFFRSENSNKSSSTAAADSHNLYTLFEQMNDLKETNSTLKKELQEAKLELESLKVTSLAWKRTCDDFKPGALSGKMIVLINIYKIN